MDFKAVVKEQRGELERIGIEERIVERELLEKAKKFLKHPNILAVIGVRRCGKSIFSYLLAKENNFGYINFDDERLAGTKTEDLNKILEAFYTLYGDINYVILDEIQDVEGWELFANRLRRTKRVIITGSNSKLLAGELATHLTGRYIDVALFPFSFPEFLDLKGFRKAAVYTTREKAELLKFLNEYLKIGGFPEVNKFGKAMLLRIYDDVITKDVLLRYGIRKKEDLKQLARYLVTNFCEEISYSRLAKTFGVKHVSTLSNWISYLENSFLVFKLERFAFKLRQQFLAPKKIYCVDNGLVTAIGFGVSENFGKLMENSVAVELQRRKFPDRLTELYYWKDHQQNEVDFVLKEGPNVKELIQVTYASSRGDVKERETKALTKASKELKCRNLLVITWDYEGEEKIDGREIRFTPLWKWLLAELASQWRMRA